MLLIVSGDDGLKSSEGTGEADIKTKRLFVTGEAQHILFVRFSSFVYSYIICIPLFRSISILTVPNFCVQCIAGLSFYTSEKTLRAAFEPFGELVEGL